MTKRVKQITNMMEEIQINEQNIRQRLQHHQKMKQPMRAVFIVLDMTKTIQMKDFKPSRLSVATQMIKQFIKKSKQSTPFIMYSFSIVEEEICKIQCPFTLDCSKIFEMIDLLKVENNGFFSLQNVLRSALDAFENVSNCYQKYFFNKKRQILIIQASSLTKDYRNIYDTIQIFHQAKIKVNIISMVGWTHVFKVIIFYYQQKKLVQKTQGKYVTVGSNEEFKKFVEQISLPSQINDQNIQKTIFKVALCKKQYSQKGVQCFCHMKQVQNYYVCGFCCAITCKTPPIECSVCRKIIMVPSDLSRHKLVIDSN